MITVSTEISELEELFSFRYRIYVEEMQRKQKYASHASKQIRDPLDDFATNLIARDADGGRRTHVKVGPGQRNK